AGLAPELDVIRAQAQLRQTRAEAAPLQEEIDRATHALAILIGLSPSEPPAEILTERDLPELPEDFPNTVPADILLRRADLRHESAEIVSAAATLGVAHADLYPKVTLAGVVGPAINLGALALGIGNFFSITPSVRLPLFTGGRLRSNVAVAK